MPLVIPALNRDGDCLSDLVMPMFGSIAGAESVLLAFDDDYEVDVAMAEAPHGTAPGAPGQGHREPDGDDPRLRRRPALRRGAGRVGGRHRVARDLRVGARGDRGRRADARPRRARRRPPSSRPRSSIGCRTKLDVWSSLGALRASGPRRLRPTGSPAASRASSPEVLDAPPAVDEALDHEREDAGGEDRGDVDRELGDRAAPGRPSPRRRPRGRCWRRPGSSSR